VNWPPLRDSKDAVLSISPSSERRRANRLQMSAFESLLRLPIYVINPIDKTKLSCFTSHRRNTAVSLETYPFIQSLSRKKVIHMDVRIRMFKYCYSNIAAIYARGLLLVLLFTVDRKNKQSVTRKIRSQGSCYDSSCLGGNRGLWLHVCYFGV